MRRKIAETVLFWGLAGAGCATPAKEPPVKPARSSLVGLASASGAPSHSVAQAAPAAPPSAAPAGPDTGSAYFGCGQPIPGLHLWDETSESQVLEAITAAKACAAEQGRHLLLEFVAPWCEDCREMAKLDETAVVTEQLRARFERVRVNVGKWDRHEGLRKNYDVHALATYIVIDPKTNQQLAKTTLEPITKKGQKLSAEQWAAWLREH